MSRQQRVCARPCHALLAGKVVLPLLLRAVVQDKVKFEANLQAVRSTGLTLGSKLLRLATGVQQ